VPHKPDPNRPDHVIHVDDFPLPCGCGPGQVAVGVQNSYDAWEPVRTVVQVDTLRHIGLQLRRALPLTGMLYMGNPRELQGVHVFCVHGELLSLTRDYPRMIQFVSPPDVLDFAVALYPVIRG
jgi:hypothetical protein